MRATYYMGKTMKKRLLSILILTVFALFLFCYGCGNEEKFPIKEYTVSYFFFENSPDNRSETVVYGEPLVTPFPTVEKSSYTFGGWYYGEENREFTSGTKYSFDSDMTFTAKWTATGYTITLDADGGTLSETTISVEYGTNLTLPVPEKTGYTFAGWYYNNSLILTDYTYLIEDNPTFIARWSVDTYSITYNLSGGIFSESETVPMTYEFGQEVILPTPQKTGYNFDGWKDEDGNAVTKITSDSTGNRSFTAFFTAIEYTVSFENAEIDDVKALYNEPLSLPVPEKTGYTFAGWRVNSENGDTIKSGDAFSYAEDVTLYAIYSPIVFVISYNLNGGNGLTEDAPKTFTVESEEIILPSPQKTGYNFGGWKDEKGNVITVISSGSTGNLNLTAVWTVKILTITLNANGGTVTTTTIFVEYGKAAVLPVPTKDNMVFLGWYDPSGVKVEDTTVWSDDVTLTAKWDGAYYTVNFELEYGGGTSKLKNPNAPLTVTVSSGETLGDKLPTLQSRSDSDDYYFAGWFYRDDGGKEIKITEDTVFENMNDSDFIITVYAKLLKAWVGPF